MSKGRLHETRSDTFAEDAIDRENLVYDASPHKESADEANHSARNYMRGPDTTVNATIEQ